MSNKPVRNWEAVGQTQIDLDGDDMNPDTPN